MSVSRPHSFVAQTQLTERIEVLLGVMTLGGQGPSVWGGGFYVAFAELFLANSLNKKCNYSLPQLFVICYWTDYVE